MNIHKAGSYSCFLGGVLLGILATSKIKIREDVDVTVTGIQGNTIFAKDTVGDIWRIETNNSDLTEVQNGSLIIFSNDTGLGNQTVRKERVVNITKIDITSPITEQVHTSNTSSHTGSETLKAGEANPALPTNTIKK